MAEPEPVTKEYLTRALRYTIDTYHRYSVETSGDRPHHPAKGHSDENCIRWIISLNGGSGGWKNRNWPADPNENQMFQVVFAAPAHQATNCNLRWKDAEGNEYSWRELGFEAKKLD